MTWVLRGGGACVFSLWYAADNLLGRLSTMVAHRVRTKTRVKDLNASILLGVRIIVMTVPLAWGCFARQQGGPAFIFVIMLQYLHSLAEPADFIYSHAINIEQIPARKKIFSGDAGPCMRWPTGPEGLRSGAPRQVCGGRLDFVVPLAERTFIRSF